MLNKPLILHEEDGVQKVMTPNYVQGKLASFGLKYLQPRGYFNDNVCMDEEGYIPWFSYPSIDFVKQIINRNTKVLEYGSGYSTLFWKKHCGMICSIEHDKAWAEKMNAVDSTLKINVVQKNEGMSETTHQYLQSFIAENFHIPRSQYPDHDEKHGLMLEEYISYAGKIFDFPKGTFDVVVVDGMARTLCGYFAAQYINDNPDGYIILDNSERWHYNSLHTYLIKNGFGRIDFFGPSFMSNEGHCTSIFSRRFRVCDITDIERPVTDGLITV
jgi:hypothetical protein